MTTIYFVDFVSKIYYDRLNWYHDYPDCDKVLKVMIKVYHSPTLPIRNLSIDTPATTSPNRT